MKILSLQLTGFQTLKKSRIILSSNLYTETREKKSTKREQDSHEEGNNRSSVCRQENWRINSKGK